MKKLLIMLIVVGMLLFVSGCSCTPLDMICGAAIIGVAASAIEALDINTHHGRTAEENREITLEDM